MSSNSLTLLQLEQVHLSSWKYEACCYPSGRKNKLIIQPANSYASKLRPRNACPPTGWVTMSIIIVPTLQPKIEDIWSKRSKRLRTVFTKPCLCFFAIRVSNVAEFNFVLQFLKRDNVNDHRTAAIDLQTEKAARPAAYGHPAKTKTHIESARSVRTLKWKALFRLTQCFRNVLLSAIPRNVDDEC